MPTEVKINPSAEARQLFNVLVARADGKELPLETLVRLSVERSKRGLHEGVYMAELNHEGWIERADHGGFRIAL